MPVAWRIADGLIVLNSEGDATFEEWKTAVRAALASAESATVSGVVHDSRRATRILSLEEAKERVAFLQQQSRISGIQRWAVVVTGIIQVGMARWGESFQAETVERFRTFEDLDEARAWALGERPSPSSKT
jgi:hypothetical protein